MFASLKKILFNEKALGGAIVTSDIWFKNISVGIKVKTNSSKKNLQIIIISM